MYLSVDRKSARPVCFSGGVMIYFDRIEVVNELNPAAGQFLRCAKYHLAGEVPSETANFTRWLLPV